jgi:hypothetical protein
VSKVESETGGDAGGVLGRESCCKRRNDSRLDPSRIELPRRLFTAATCCIYSHPSAIMMFDRHEVPFAPLICDPFISSAILLSVSFAIPSPSARIRDPPFSSAPRGIVELESGTGSIVALESGWEPEFDSGLRKGSKRYTPHTDAPCRNPIQPCASATESGLLRECGRGGVKL